jgi:nucleoside-diphosphate-sugar epimerase
MAVEQSHWHGRPVKFMFPSSIAAYGLPGRTAKQGTGKVRETEWNFPTTMYGCNKLYCEHLGRYYANHYRQLAADSSGHGIDFRCIRFPGLISAVTLPSGGTTDYAPEMIHAAAAGRRYGCFVVPDTRLPFIVMPDAVNALLQLQKAPRKQLRQTEYNVSSFSMTAAEIHQRILEEWRQAEIDFKPDPKRQAIVDSWPAEVDDSAARTDWGWVPRYDKEAAFSQYLIPRIKSRYP